jgi:hypothetical protein
MWTNLSASCGVSDYAKIFCYCVLPVSDPSRAGHFGTEGLAVTFVLSDSDQQVMAAIQLRFEVAVPELPDHINPASYSMQYLSLM